METKKTKKDNQLNKRHKSVRGTICESGLAVSVPILHLVHHKCHITGNAGMDSATMNNLHTDGWYSLSLFQQLVLLLTLFLKIIRKFFYCFYTHAWEHAFCVRCH